TKLAAAQRIVEGDLDVDFPVRAVDAAGIVDKVGIDTPAVQRVFDPPALAESEVAAFAHDLAAQVAAVDSQGVVAAVAHIGVSLAGGLDVGADAAVPEQVHRRL